MIGNETMKEIRNINELAWFILTIETAQDGFFIENVFNEVSVNSDNAAGKYTCRYMDFIIKYTNDPVEAYNFLKNYRYK